MTRCMGGLELDEAVAWEGMKSCSFILTNDTHANLFGGRPENQALPFAATA